MVDAPTTNDDHDQGYVDGVRDCAAWAGQYAASILAEADALERQGQALIAAAQRLHENARILLGKASGQHARFADRRDWDLVKALAAENRGKLTDAPPHAYPSAKPAEAKLRRTRRPKWQGPPEPQPVQEPARAYGKPAELPPTPRLTDAQQDERARANAWRA